MNTNNNFSPDTFTQRSNISRQGADGVRTGVQTPNLQWLTVEEAYQYLLDHGISRSQKTIRRRCHNGDFEQMQRTETPNGFRYEISKDSLNIYIKAEKVNEVPRRIHVNMSAPVSEQDTNTSAQSADMSGHPKEVRGGEDELQELRDKVTQLENDKSILEIEKKVAYQMRDYVQKMADNLYEDFKCKQSEHSHLTDNLQYKLGEAHAQLKLLRAPESLIHKRGDNTTQNTSHYDVQ